METFDETNQYVSLANKYRPQKFEDMVGQESISKTLQNALKLGRIAHAYLFYGPRGCGKTTTARILAKALNCTGNGNGKPTDEPCGECPQCREIAQSADMDVLELDAASNTQVEKVREAIIDTVALAASRDRFKVFILDEVHMLSASSFNALLKTIEEPPAHVVFILATTEKHKVPATIVSRCQTFRFRPITVDEITTHLMDLAEAEGLDLTEKAAQIIAKNAGGALRDALTLMDRAIAFSDGKIDEKLVGEMLGLTPQELLSQTITAMVQKDNASLHNAFETLRAEGFDANSFLKDLKNALGDLFYFSVGHGKTPFEGAEKI
ncbi:MAG: DNA polymerase III subunit gamma/tau, partial [Elusimicrobiaceae bacterium]|nr:DNA polymerase III subunit gamma/tau [Elusimicrobiaceae bacterium]